MNLPTKKLVFNRMVAPSLLILMGALALHAAPIEKTLNFENGLEDWDFDTKKSNSKVTPEVTQEAAKSGSAGLRFVDPGDKKFGQILSKSIPVNAGEKVTAKVNARLVSGKGAGVRLMFEESGGNSLDDSAAPKKFKGITSTDWKEFSLEETAPDKATGVRVVLKTYDPAEATVDFDDITISIH